jgi:transcriptional regulator with XRE-family HTH domain
MEKVPRSQSSRAGNAVAANNALPSRGLARGADRSGAEAAVMTKAVVRAANLLRLSQREIAGMLGVSAATASRLFAGSYRVSPERPKEWELARLFVRMFRSLDALWGHGDAARDWLSSHNLALAARPVELIGSVDGLVRVVAYLDNARGRL